MTPTPATADVVDCTLWENGQLDVYGPDGLEFRVCGAEIDTAMDKVTDRWPIDRIFCWQGTTQNTARAPFGAMERVTFQRFAQLCILARKSKRSTDA